MNRIKTFFMPRENAAWMTELDFRQIEKRGNIL